MTSPTFTRYTTPESFFAATKSILEKHDVYNGLSIGNISRCIQYPDRFQNPYMTSVFRGPDLVLTAIRIPPSGLVLSYTEEIDDTALRLIASDLLAVYGARPDPETPGRGIPGVVGVKPLAYRFAEIWADMTAQRYDIHLEMTIYQLTAVQWPTNRAEFESRGRLRLAEEDDRALVRVWLEQFTVDCGLRNEVDFDSMAGVTIGDRRLYLWEVNTESGGTTVVSMAARARPTNKGITINMVYTPPEHRGKGYSSITMATLSSLLLAEGYEYVSLFANVKNLISNRVYQKVGYVVLGEQMDLGFYEIEK
ncbi:hypothetical protein BC936DRAFT_144089 [Jimgerdemannia flammicorona]|uniref:Uncharacterized protein n=2 Tax=Jimgerdemannia flammicorona TaxID=994334 RepID=A0A433Q5X3_9FUNG|nr:hypothetical protein BC936DRAFT_144089 [Jimgerdemannia flammicorona]RUS25171.1 hypothetical protein BC938DRAFT_472530 [Jimgerdemannia flammicorona]